MFIFGIENNVLFGQIKISFYIRHKMFWLFFIYLFIWY
jgi:hypothetical protein